MPKRGETPEPEIPAQQEILRLEGWATDIPVVSDENGNIFWPVRALCVWLGVDRGSQLRRLREHRRLAMHLRYFAVKWSMGGTQPTWCIEQKWVGFWLGTMDSERVRSELADKLAEFQDELAEYANFRLFGDESTAHFQELSPQQIQAIVQHLGIDVRTLKLAWRNMEKRLGTVEGQIALMPADDEPEQ